MFNILHLLGLKPNKEQKAETLDSSGRHIANANVMGWPSCLSIKVKLLIICSSVFVFCRVC